MKNIVLSTLLVLFGTSLFSARAWADDPMAVGKAALQKGDLVTAINAFREAVKDDKKNKEAYILLGTALFRADSLDEATSALIQARELDTADARVFLLQGNVYEKQKIFAAAIEQYKKASELERKNPEILLRIADLERKQRQYNDAAGSYLKVLSLDSLNANALGGLGTILYRAKQYANAVPVLEKLYNIHPDSLPVQIMYARSLGETKRCEQFIPIAEKVLEREKLQPEIENLLADCYNSTGKIKEAIAAYRKRNPDSLKTDDLIRFAKALRTDQSLDSAALVYKMVLDRDSSRCDYLYDFGTLYMKMKKYSDAVDMFEKKIACDTSAGYRFASHLNAAMSLMQLKKFRDAKDHIQKSIDLRPDNVQAWQTLAQDEAQLTESSEEIKAYQKVIELGTADPGETRYNNSLQEAYRMIGVTYLIDKKYAQSVDYLKNAIKYTPKSDPNYCPLLLWTAQAYHNSNNKEEAKRFYCRVLENCSKGKEAKDAQSGLDILGMKCGQ